MKKLLIVAAVASLAATSAHGADIAARAYTKAPAYAAPAYNWTGFYVGAHIGGAWRGNDDFTVITGGTASGGDSFIFGGGQLGADYQFAPNWLMGIEGQISALGNSMRVYQELTPTNFITTSGSDWLASVTGRLGYIWGPGLIYAKGGVAFRDRPDVVVNLVPTFTSRLDDTGYTVGGGVEYMFAPSWSAKVEYQYYNFGNSNVTTGAGVFAAPGAGFREDLHTVKAGINYHFNWGGPVVAKY